MIRRFALLSVLLIATATPGLAATCQDELRQTDAAWLLDGFTTPAKPMQFTVTGARGAILRAGDYREVTANLHRASVACAGGDDRTAKAALAEIAPILARIDRH